MTQIAFAAAMVGAWVLLYFSVETIHHYLKHRSLRLHGGFINEARVATDLVPLLTPYITSKCKIFIMGGDGLPIHKKNYRWEGDIVKWLDKNCQIEYMLIDPNPDALKRLKELSRQHKNLTVYFLRSHQHIRNVKDKSYISNFKTYHPVLVQAEAGKLMWLEKFHPSGSSVAYDCEFVLPAKADNDNRYISIYRDIKRIKKYAQKV